MNFELTEEQVRYEALVRDFARQEVAPHVAEYDREERYPVEIIKKAAALGLLGGVIPEAYGGAGLDHVTFAVGLEEMARVCIHVASAMARASGLVGSAILRYGTEEQKQKYLVPLASGDAFGGTGVTEPHSGSDVAAMETTAVRKGDEYVLNGSKIWISGVGVASWFLTFAQLDRSKGSKGICAFIVDRGAPGFRTRTITNKLGFRPSPVGELIFEDCRVPRTNLVGREGEGLKVALTAVENGRLSVAARAVGLAQACLDESVAYAQQRVTFGRPIMEYQLVQAKITDMVVGIEAGRFLTYRLAWLRDRGVRRARREAAIAKLYTTEVALRAASDAVQIHGAYGVSDEHAVGRHFRDAKVLQIVEGVNDLQRALIAEYALGLRREPVEGARGAVPASGATPAG
ncbi:MAG: acyl-CoA dehydrogenase family protein [Candidatus Rokubacteria bacterium]|nr:acyl-CoA dehydrogenase family protein [Candidatus Rokubacteria bacterium]